jgi:hypothetical protein
MQEQLGLQRRSKDAVLRVKRDEHFHLCAHFKILRYFRPWQQNHVVRAEVTTQLG